MSEPQAINHRELEYPHPDAEHVPPEMRDTVDLVRWAEHVNRGAGLAICAALLEVSGSLNLPPLRLSGRTGRHPRRATPRTS